MDKLREKYQGANSEIAGLTQREMALVSQIAETESDVETYAGALEDLKMKLLELESEEANSSLSEEQLAAKRRAAEEQIAGQRKNYESFKEEREEKSKTLRAAELEYAALKAAIASTKARRRFAPGPRRDAPYRVKTRRRSPFAQALRPGGVEEMS